jgi:hypothetical protein
MHSYIGKENAGSGNPFNIYAKQKKKAHAVATSSLVHTGCNRLVYIFLSNFDTLQSCTFLTGLFM